MTLAIERLLQDLVAIPSVNPMGRPLVPEIMLEHRMTDYLERYFRDLGVLYERHPVAPGRENIIATWKNSGAKRTLMLEAHQDTVPVDGMVIPPFEPTIEAGKIFGRGSCDIKGGMAAMLTAFARLVREKPAGACNVVMACSVDEENTMLGVRELVKRKVHADLAVVAEPTKLNIVHAHKGVVRWLINTPGRSCHSSAPEQGTNAIYRMAKILNGIEAFAAHIGKTIVDPLLGPATMSVGLIHGGISVNTVPDHCQIQIDRRVVGGEKPEETPGQLEAFLRETAKIDFPYEMTKPWICERALTPTGSDEIIRLLGQAIDQVRGSHRVHSVPYGTDAATLAWSGIPTVIFGPGDIAQAHTKDEWLAIDELHQAAEILYRLAFIVEK